MDYYSTLGLKRGASDADIKKAYRSMAMKHHPDRGGDEKKFKEISQAYEFLTDPQKKSIIDMGGDPAQQNSGGGHDPFGFHFNSGNFHDIFSNFGFARQAPRNRSFSVSVEITLEEVLTGKEINAEVGAPGGKSRVVNISIPPGIDHGQQIRYGGMGDSSIPNAPPGDLIVNVYVRPHAVFRREGNSLVYEKTISVWDALLGTSIDITTLDRKTLSITIPQGTQPDTIMSCRGEGLPNVRSKDRGNLLIKIKVNVPKNLTSEQIDLIKQINK